jgi:hypothetical protein
MKGFRKAALAALLIGVTSLLPVAAPWASLHQRLHDDGCGGGGACALCMMIQGQMDFAAPAPIQDTFVSVFIGMTPVVNSAETPRVDLRLSPSRAPPCR